MLFGLFHIVGETQVLLRTLGVTVYSSVSIRHEKTVDVSLAVTSEL